MSRIVTLPHWEPYIRCLWLAVKLLRGYAARMLPPATSRTLTLVTNRCQCSGQFIFPAVFSASLSSPFPIQHLNWVRTNVAHLRLGINKQSVWREQESRIHFATQKKFNVNKQCITALSTLQSPSLAHHNLFNSAGLLVDIVDKAEHNDGCCPNTTARECTRHLSADRRRSHGVSFKPRNNASSTHFIPLKVISNNK